MLLSAEVSMNESSNFANKKTGVEKNGLGYWGGERPWWTQLGLFLYNIKTFVLFHCISLLQTTLI